MLLKKRGPSILYLNISIIFEAHKRYQNLSEEKEKRQKKACERYENFTEKEKEKQCNKNLSEEQEQKLVEYRRNNYLTHLRLSNFYRSWDN